MTPTFWASTLEGLRLEVPFHRDGKTTEEGQVREEYQARVLGAEVEMPCRHPSRGFGRLAGHMSLEFQKEVQDRELNVRASAQRGYLKS